MALASPCHGQVIFPLKCVSQLLVTCVLIGSQCDRHCQPGCQTRNMEQQDLLLCRALLMSLGHKIWRYDCIDILDILLRFTYIMDTTWVESKRKLTARATFHELAFYFATFKQHEMFEGCRVLLPCTAPLPIGNVRPHCLFHALHNFSDAHASNIGAQANPSCPEKVVKNSSSSLQASFDWTFTCSYAKIKIVSAVYMMNQYEYIDILEIYIYIYIDCVYVVYVGIRHVIQKVCFLRLASKLGSPCCLQPLFLLTSHSHLSQSLLKRQNPREPKWDPQISFAFMCFSFFCFTYISFD